MQRLALHHTSKRNYERAQSRAIGNRQLQAPDVEQQFVPSAPQDVSEIPESLGLRTSRRKGSDPWDPRHGKCAKDLQIVVKDLETGKQGPDHNDET